MPTGGVDHMKDSIRSWVEAGVVCVGMGSKLISKEDLASKNYAMIVEIVRNVLEWIREIRQEA